MLCGPCSALGMMDCDEGCGMNAWSQLGMLGDFSFDASGSASIGGGGDVNIGGSGSSQSSAGSVNYSGYSPGDSFGSSPPSPAPSPYSGLAKGGAMLAYSPSQPQYQTLTLDEQRAAIAGSAGKLAPVAASLPMMASGTASSLLSGNKKYYLGAALLAAYLFL